jgi:hypothetical protein
MVGWVKTDMGLAKGQQARIEAEESTCGIVSVIERAAVLQSKSSFASPFQFYSSIKETHAAERFQQMTETLQKENFVKVQYDGTVMDW